MKTLRQLSKYTFLKSLIIFSIFFSSVIAEDEPIDIWKIEKKEKIIDNNSEIEDISDTESNLKIINTPDPYTQIISTTPLEDKDLIVIDLEKEGFLVKTEEHLNKVGFSERTDAVIEPKLSMQWFCKMEKLSKPALEHVMNDNIKLHNQIMKLTKVKLMGEILESQLIHLQYLRKKFIIESNSAVKSIDEHNDIVRSLVAGQASKAEKLLKNHALTLVDKIQESINS